MRKINRRWPYFNHFEGGRDTSTCEFSTLSTRNFRWVKTKVAANKNSFEELILTFTLHGYPRKLKLLILRNFQNSISRRLSTTTQHTTHIPLVDKMCKYEMDPASILQGIYRGHNSVLRRRSERTSRRTDGRVDKVRRVYLSPFNFVEAADIIINDLSSSVTSNMYKHHIRYGLTKTCDV